MSVSIPPGAKDPTLTPVPASSTESARMRGHSVDGTLNDGVDGSRSPAEADCLG